MLTNKRLKIPMKKKNKIIIMQNGEEYKGKASINQFIKSTTSKIQETKGKIENKVKKDMFKHNLFFDKEYGVSIDSKYLKIPNFYGGINTIIDSLFIATIMKIENDYIIVNITNSTFLAEQENINKIIEKKIKLQVSDFVKMKKNFLKDIISYTQNLSNMKIESQQHCRKIMKENKKLKNERWYQKNIVSKEFCCCCLDFPDTIFPCGHLACCEKCVSQLRKKECPICRKSFNHYIKVYRNNR